MALIKCEECGREISDKVKACPHCGCPLESSDEEKLEKQPKKQHSRRLLIALVGILIVLVIGGVTYYGTAIRPKKMYEQAVALLEKGKYEDATELLNKIPKYQDVKDITQQMKYESMAYECITDLKKYLKNPDSFQPYEINFYNLKEDKEGTEQQILQIENEKPLCVMHYGAQNGFGGNTTGYVLFMYSEEDGRYITLGSCDSLDKDEIDEDEATDLLICEMINLCKEKGESVGEVDMARIKEVLKNDAYSTIKIIE